MLCITCFSVSSDVYSERRIYEALRSRPRNTTLENVVQEYNNDQLDKPPLAIGDCKKHHCSGHVGFLCTSVEVGRPGLFWQHFELARTCHVQIIFDELLAILARRSGHKDNTSGKYATLGAGRAPNQTWTGYLLGTNPTFDVYTFLNSKLDVLAASQLIGVAFRPVSANIFLAIRKAQGDKYEESKGEISKLWHIVRSDVTNVMEIFITAEVANPVQIPTEEDQNVSECVNALAVADVYAGFAAIFDGIYLLADALHNLRTNDDVEKYSSELLAIRKKAVEHFDAEVNEKYDQLRNLIITNIFEETGILPGLFALQSLYDDYITV